MKFDITFERITEESAEHGDVSARGFAYEGIGLREAFSVLNCGAYCEANDSNLGSATWITFYDMDEDFLNGEYENMSLHFPRNLSASIRIRICRLFRVYGFDKSKA